MSCFARYSMSPLRTQSICNKHFMVCSISKSALICSRSRKAKILTTGIHVVFRGLKFEPDADIGQKGTFDEERQNLIEEIKKLEAVMCMD